LFFRGLVLKEWRLLDTGHMTAAQNMAMDDTLLELKGERKTPDTIRFLQFSPPSVLVGFHQAVNEEIRESYCLEKGIEINRRITGGGAIFFDETQIGWEVICDKDFFKMEIPNQRLFNSLCEPVVKALGYMGLKAAFRPRNDIEINGRKISGTGGTESGRAFLFQGTMLVDFDVDTMLKSLRIPIEKLKAKEIDSVKERVTCLNWEFGHTPSSEEIKNAIIMGFEECLDIKLVPAGLTEEEQTLFKEKLAFYSSPGWIEMVKPKLSGKEILQAANKVENGLVRFTVAVDRTRNRIKDIFITGDFLSFPGRALYDLESALRGQPFFRKELFNIVDSFFREGRITIPGISSEEFFKPLEIAIEKAAIATEFGIPLEDCNNISVTNNSFKDVIEAGPTVLLLPYCAKDLVCHLRHTKTCRQCGTCTVGSAWDIGLKRKLDVRCVSSFEDLLSELDRLKRLNEKAFIGCCCQPFFTKHVNDFERAGLPGILLNIDNTTCYELDQVKEAYKGEFNSQTHINISLLETVLDVMDSYKTRGGA
jgi:lipoate---protein ligase